MKKSEAAKPVERLFPFVLRSRILIVGRETLQRSKSNLHFVLITHDVSENTREEILKDFAHYPIVQHYSPEELEKFRSWFMEFDAQVWDRQIEADSKSGRLLE
jgi:hypothetical protein